jgi:orotate phosphoribosyltransferase
VATFTNSRPRGPEAADFALKIRWRSGLYERLSLTANMSNLSALKSELLEALAEKSVHRGNFTLASGAQSDLYVDAKLTTLDPRCALLVGKVGWELVKEAAAARGLHIDAIGGLTMGADAIALMIGVGAQLDDPANTVQTFNVRKEPKKHGRNRHIEGNFLPGNTVVVIDDVITTGGSTLQAIDKIEAEGGKVAFAVVLVDRQEQNGRENIEKRCPVISFFDRKDVLAAHAKKLPHSAAA